MSYQRDRDQFVASMTREGLPLHVIDALLRAATGFNRRAELACSSEAADRDRVPCPAASTYTKTIRGNTREFPRKPNGPCLCDDYPTGLHAAGRHSDITRITLQDWRTEHRLIALLASDAPGWTLQTAGDPRGYTLRVIPPSYAARNSGRDIHNLDAIGVPSRPSGLRF
jgi:hypothetical protein